MDEGMKKRTLGKSGPLVTPIGLGTMSWPGCGFGSRVEEEISPQAAIEMVQAAVEAGIGLIDTAEGYGRGLAETHLGIALRELGCRERVTIVTKTGPLFAEEQENGRGCNLSEKHLAQRTEAALKRLGVDTLDVLLAHWPDPETPIEETMGAVEKLKAAGKVRYFGVSNFSNELLAEALRYGEVICNQLPCSLADRSIEDGRRQFCLEQGVGIMAYSPIGKGVLSGKYDVTHLPPTDDYRYQRPHFGENLSRNLELAGTIRRIAAELEVEPVAVALAWTILLPGITVAVPGAKSPEQIRGHVLAMELAADETASRRICEELPF